jgi:PH/SEC7 domain-containing protein
VKRYRTYSYMLRSRMAQYTEHVVSLVENSIGEVDEATGVTLMDGPSGGIVPPPIPDRPSPPTNRSFLYCCCGGGDGQVQEWLV